MDGFAADGFVSIYVATCMHAWIVPSIVTCYKVATNQADVAMFCFALLIFSWLPVTGF